MALKHKSVGKELSEEEWEGEDTHLLNGRVAGSVILTSIPPSGMCRIINIYYDPELKKAIFEYEDVPA